MRDRTEFDHLVREALANLYDVAALETHPLSTLIPRPPEYRGTGAEFLRKTIGAAIEQLRPGDKPAGRNTVEWRPYLILNGRYVEGNSLQDLQTRLSLSERQLRREHSRALQALSTLLWNQTVPNHRTPEPESPQAGN